MVEDVTERRLLEAVRTDFVANISHELKTPVGAMGLLAETLCEEDDPEVVARLAARVQTEASRMARTIDDLLELSRIESAAPMAVEPIAVRALVAETVTSNASSNASTASTRPEAARPVGQGSVSRSCATSCPTMGAPSRSSPDSARGRRS